MVFDNVRFCLWKNALRQGRGLCGRQRRGGGGCHPGAGFQRLVRRGDPGGRGPIVIGENANVQDNAVLHCDAGGQITLGRGVTIGHGAIVHGAEVGEGSLIGMHATLLNGCKVGRHCIIGAGALVPEGKVIPDGTVAVGVPARVVKDAAEAQTAAAEYNAIAYVNLGRSHAAATPLESAKTEE